jgi:hypothetical protein
MGTLDQDGKSYVIVDDIQRTLELIGIKSISRDDLALLIYDAQVLVKAKRSSSVLGTITHTYIYIASRAVSYIIYICEQSLHTCACADVYPCTPYITQILRSRCLCHA